VLEVDGCSTYDFDRCNTDSFKHFERRMHHYMHFLTSLSGFQEMRPQISYLHNISGATRQILKNTIFINKKAIAYCHLVSRRFISINGLCFDRGPSTESWDSTLCGATVLATYFDAQKYTEDRVLAIYLAARSVAKSRYNGVALNIATQALTPPVTSQVFNNLYEIAREGGLLHLLHRQNLRWNKMCLHRFGAAGSYHITYRREPYKAEGHRYVSVDTMVIDNDAVMFIDVDGLLSPFDSTGHRPVLVDHDAVGKARYVALVEQDSNSWQCFGCVREGASTVTYEYGGKTHVTHKFKVMVLRHDPTYLYPPSPTILRAQWTRRDIYSGSGSPFS